MLTMVVTIVGCSGIQNASYNGDHSSATYSKESGINANASTNNATININKHNASTAQ